MERGRGGRIAKQKRKALLAEIVLLLLQTLNTTAHSTPLGTYSKSMHTDRDISWIKASPPGFISTLTSPFLKRETELTEGKVGGCGPEGIWEELGDCQTPWSSLPPQHPLLPQDRQCLL